MQGLNDKRQATATIGLSANADLLPAQLIVAGEPHCIGALPVLDGVRYLPATGGKVVPSTGKCDGDTGAIPTAIRARAVPLPLPAQWIGHAVQTLDHWSNIPTTYAILEHIIVPWLSKMKARMGLPQTQTCILVVWMVQAGQEQEVHEVSGLCIQALPMAEARLHTWCVHRASATCRPRNGCIHEG